jgi:hypothetical protein
MDEIAIVDNSVLPLMEREKAEIQSAIISAKKFPRDEEASYLKLVKNMARPSLAEKAQYQFPRSGKDITGPSVHFAREAARCWGNVRYGLKIVDTSTKEIHIKGYAVDLESNSYVELEDKFNKLVQRKYNGVTSWVSPDERDLRELMNKRGAILIRNCILQLIPADIVEEGILSARNALVADSKEDLDSDRLDVINKIEKAFSKMKVTKSMLEDYLKNPLTEITPDQIAELRSIQRTILDGNSKASEYFKNKSSSAQELNDLIAGE